MKWSTNGVKTTLDILKELLIIILIAIILLGIILGRIEYLQLINILDTRPTQGFIAPIKLPKLGIVSPWGYGDFREIYIRKFNQISGWLVLKIGNHQSIYIEIPQEVDLKQGYWAYWKEREKNIQEYERTNNSWLIQEFGTYAEVYIYADFDTRNVVIVLFGEDGRVFFKKVKANYAEGGCGGGYKDLYYYKK
ncbi:MAG: hypothetical protein QXF86_03215 [Candidatus Bilamarchaeaceae archaeon]